MQRRRLLSLGLLVLLLIFILLSATHAQAVNDWYRLRGYTPPTNISKIVIEDKFTDSAKRTFYVTRPKLVSPGGFDQYCPQNEKTIVLGCYHSGAGWLTNNSSLFVKSVSDSRLAGVEEVTAAHEMLHAAYDRLSTKEKDRVNAMLTEFYKNELKDQRILDTVNSYKQTEPDDVINEMHSVFGTEITNLPAPLEQYYSQYFTNRQAVTAFADSYEGEFTRRDNQIKNDDIKLAQMHQNIQAEEADLTSQLTTLNSERASIERSNDPSAIDSYNAKINVYNYNIKKLQRDIAAYNSLVEERNDIAADLRSLRESLNTGLAAQPAQ